MFRYPCQRDQARRPASMRADSRLLLPPAQEVSSRREFLSRWGMGLGGVALSSILHAEMHAAERRQQGILERLHHPARAKSVIFLYMDGGPGQMDTLDPKPVLRKLHGQPFPVKKEPTQFDNNGTTFGSPWEFRQYGQSGIWISDLFPNLSRHADKLCVVRSMTSKFSEHTSANYFLHTGLGIVGRPSMGAWAVYGLGTEADDLPGFVVINGGLTPPGGLDNFASGFLPASYQASIFSPQGSALANLTPPTALSEKRENAKRKLLQQFDDRYLEKTQNADPIESAISNYELAYRMQTSVPEASDLHSETQATLDLYGVDHEYQPAAIFARECLLARRLVERGVRFIELTCPAVSGDRWDQHSKLKQGHENNARAVDQPIAALLEDLEQRGLLEQTLVVWTGEFGRTPFAQGSDGRDHNPFAFSMWMCGGGVRPGTVFGATDEFGYKVVEDPVDIHDLHATMLHLLGVDHERLTFRFGGRDHRLTDVHGRVLRALLA